MADKFEDEAQAVVSAYLKKRGYRKALKQFRKDCGVAKHRKPELSLSKLIHTKLRHDRRLLTVESNSLDEIGVIADSAGVKAAKSVGIDSADASRKRKRSGGETHSQSDVAEATSNQQSLHVESETSESKKSKTKATKASKRARHGGDSVDLDKAVGVVVDKLLYDAGGDKISSEDILSDKRNRRQAKQDAKARQNEPFKRVVGSTDEVMPELRDNSYEGTFGRNGWGAKASADLIATRGKGFRHAKTKKKRGSYRGGQIDTSSTNSFKFPDSD